MNRNVVASADSRQHSDKTGEMSLQKDDNQWLGNTNQKNISGLTSKSIAHTVQAKPPDSMGVISVGFHRLVKTFF